ncbi:MAG: hypothetical protein ACR2RD_14425 [Woeseiaceae bacterium]
MMTSNFFARPCKALLLCVALVSPVAMSQQTTEQFIPIGKSPGISGEYSYVGVIVAVDAENHTIEVQSDQGTKAIRIAEDTRLWLDRSKAKRTNSKASYDDCEVGVTVEVMYVYDDKATADWIKIESK